MTRQQKSGVLLALLGVMIFFVVPYQVESESSAIYPKVISVLLVLFGVLVTLLAAKPDGRGSVSLWDPLLLLSMALVLAAVVMIQFLGFYPVILVVLPLCLRLFGERDFRKSIFYSLAVVGVIYFLIDYTLGSNLP